MVPELHGITPILNVVDVATSSAFYVRHLGFELVERWPIGDSPTWASLRRGSMEIMLNTPDHGLATDRRARPAYGDTVLYCRLTEVDAWHDAMLTAGLDVTDVTDEFYGMREFYLRDPDGYVWGFGESLASPSD